MRSVQYRQDWAKNIYYCYMTAVRNLNGICLPVIANAGPIQTLKVLEINVVDGGGGGTFRSVHSTGNFDTG